SCRCFCANADAARCIGVAGLSTFIDQRRWTKGAGNTQVWLGVEADSGASGYIARLRGPCGCLWRGKAGSWSHEDAGAVKSAAGHHDGGRRIYADYVLRNALGLVRRHGLLRTKTDSCRQNCEDEDRAGHGLPPDTSPKGWITNQ